MNAEQPGGPRINPDGESGAPRSTKETAQELAQKAAEKTLKAARVTKTSFVNIFHIWARIAPDPVARAPQAVNSIGLSDAWQSLAWVALLYALTLPKIEYRMLPLLLRSTHSWIAYTFHAVALCVGVTAAVFGAAKLFGGRTTLERCAFAVSIALLPQWITLSAAGFFFDWTHGWVFGVIGFGTCIALFMLYAVFTRGFELTDRHATLAVPLALGVGGGAAFYLGKIAS